MSVEKLLTEHGKGRSLDQTSAQPSSFNLPHSPHGSTLSRHHFVDTSAELLRQGYSVRFRAPGNSMQPTISDGELITVKPVSACDIRRRDIVLYRSESAIIAHRVVQIRRREGAAPCFIILRGDAATACDRPVDAHQVLGKVTSVKRGDRTVDLSSRRVRMSYYIHIWIFRLKRWMRRYLPQALIKSFMQNHHIKRTGQKKPTIKI